MKSMSIIRKALNRVRVAERALDRDLRRALPAGSTVFWWHGNNRRSAVVAVVSGGRVLVRSREGDPSGKVYWIHAGRIAHVEREERCR